MRVAVLCFNPIDSDARVRRQAQSLARAGHEVCYVSSSGNAPRSESLVEERLHHISVPLRSPIMGATLGRTARDWGLRDILRDLEPRLFAPLPGWKTLVDEALGRALPRDQHRLARKPLGYASYLVKRALVGKPVESVTNVGSVSPDWQTGVRSIRALLDQVLHLAEVASEHRPDAVVVIDAPMLVAGHALRSKLGCQIVYDAHEIYYAQHAPGTYPELAEAFWYHAERAFLGCTDQRFAVSDSVGQYLTWDHGAGLVTTLYNVPPFREPGSKREEAEIPFRVEFHGGLTEGRGIENLVAAARHFKGASLTVIGDGPLKTTLERQTVANPNLMLRHAIPYDELVTELSAYDVCVLCYPANCRNNSVSLPNKLFEGLMAGIPILVPPRGELADLVVRHKVGLVMDSETPEGIAKSVNALVRSPARWKRMAEAARTAARDMFNWEQEEPKWLAAFGGKDT